MTYLVSTLFCGLKLIMLNYTTSFSPCPPQGDLGLDDEKKLGQEYKRLQQAMEMVGFLASTKKQYA